MRKRLPRKNSHGPNGHGGTFGGVFMKKILALFAILMTVSAVMSGCSKAEDAGTGDAAATDTAKTE